MLIHRQDARGFTLIEVTLAVALTVVLMSTVLVVTGGTRRGYQRMLDGPAGEAHPRRLIGLIRDDLTHARRVTAADTQVVMIGYGWLDEQTMTITHQPAKVTYRLEGAQDNPEAPRQLWRDQERIPGPERSTRLVHGHVHGISLVNPSSPDEDAVEPGNTAVPDAAKPHDAEATNATIDLVLGDALTHWRIDAGGSGAP